MNAKRNETHERKLFDAIVATVAEKGWDGAGLRDFADRAGLPLAELYDQIQHRHAVLPWLIEQIDRAVMASCATVSLDQSPRDRLFEILMARFDELERLRPVFTALRERPGRDAVSARLIDTVSALTSLPRSMAWMLELAALPTTGLAGAARVQGLAIVYLATLRIWIGDESEDRGITMKTLDQQLARAERWARALPR